MDNIAATNADNAVQPVTLAVNADNVVHQNTQAVHHDHGHHAPSSHFQSDVASAKMAWEAWKSNEPTQIDHALDEKYRICKEDPRAWKEAMKEIDADEAQAKRLAEMQAEMQAEAAANAAKQGPPAPGFDANGNPSPKTDAGFDANGNPIAPAAPESAALPLADAAPPFADGAPRPAPAFGFDGQPMPPQDAPQKIVAAGYAPQSEFAPPPPNTPAYNQAYNHPPDKIYGIDLPFLTLGFTNHGSFAAGVNIGLARGEVKVGLENRVEGELMPIGGPIHARVGAGFGVNQNGLHAEAGAGANFFNIAGGDLDVGGHLGQTVGVDGDLRGRAFLVNGQGDAGASLGANGLQLHGGGNADLLNTVGARGGGRVVIGPNDTGFAAGVGGKLGDKTLDVGPQLDAYPNGALSSDFHLDPAADNKTPFFPDGKRANDPPQ